MSSGQTTDAMILTYFPDTILSLILSTVLKDFQIEIKLPNGEQSSE